MKVFWKSPLRTKAFLMLLLFSLIPLFVLSLSANYSAKSIINRQLSFNVEQTMDSLVLYFEGQITDLFYLANEIARNDKIISLLKEPLESNDQLENAYSNIRTEIIREDILTRFNSPFHYLVVSDQGTVFTPSWFFPNTDSSESYISLQNDMMKLKSQIVFYRPQFFLYNTDHYFSTTGGRQIYLVRNIVYENKHLGFILIGINAESVSRLLQNYRLNKDSSLLIQNSNNRIIVMNTVSHFSDAVDLSYKNSELPFLNNLMPTQTMVLKDNKYCTVFRDLSLSKNINLNIISITPFSSIYHDIEFLSYIIFGLLLFSILSVFFLVFLIHHQIIKPILDLHRSVQSVQAGNFSVDINIRRSDEIGKLASGFSLMVGKIKSYIEEIKKEEQEKKQLEIRLLQEQIKPHFTKNTLNSIRWMAEIKGAKSVSKSLESFIKIIEYSTSKFAPLVPLKDEISHLKDYLYLSQLRFQHKFDFTFEIPEYMQDFKVLKFTLQPIVENSIIHGFLPKKGMGELKILSKVDKNNLVLVVEDDGIGIPKNDFQQITTKLDNFNDSGEANGIGLINVHKRLKLNFGQDYGLSIESIQGKGTKTSFRLPIIV